GAGPGPPGTGRRPGMSARHGGRFRPRCRRAVAAPRRRGPRAGQPAHALLALLRVGLQPAHDGVAALVRKESLVEPEEVGVGRGPVAGGHTALVHAPGRGKPGLLLSALVTV